MGQVPSRERRDQERRDPECTRGLRFAQPLGLGDIEGSVRHEAIAYKGWIGEGMLQHPWARGAEVFQGPTLGGSVFV